MSRFLSLRIGHGGHEQVIPDRGARDAVAAWRNSPSTSGSQQCRHHSESEANVVRFPPGFGNIHYEHHVGNSWLVIYALCQVMLKKQNSTSALTSWYFTRKVFIHHTFAIVSISCCLYHVISPHHPGPLRSGPFLPFTVEKAPLTRGLFWATQDGCFRSGSSPRNPGPCGS